MTLVCDSSLLTGNGWPFPVDRLPSAGYLVGGTVRDALLGRRVAHLDLDFVMPGDAIATARSIAEDYGIGFVVLDAERGIARVVFRDGTADFARQVGPTLETDLHRRDFTVNAIAVQPHGGRAIDPFDGQQDLQRRTMRMISPENLQEDPLRLLRAYRQCAQLDLLLEEETQQSLRLLAPLLKTVAAERVMSEIRALLAAPGGTRWGKVAWEDGIFKHWLPHLAPWQLTLADQVDRAIAMLSPYWAALPQAIENAVAGDTAHKKGAQEKGKKKRDKQKNQSQSPNAVMSARLASDASIEGRGLALLKLAAWLAPSGEQAVQSLQRLKTSRHDQRIVEGVLNGMQVFTELGNYQEGLPLRPRTSSLAIADQFKLFRTSHGTFPLVAALAIAAGAPLNSLLEPIERWRRPNDPVVDPQPLLSGREILQTYGPSEGRSPGPWVGELLSALALAHAESKIQTPTQAHSFAQNWIYAHCPPP
ncbi:MAG: CCA tRNA nucleotidyltransferase [Cyanobacteria bacterium P01_F01_bin.153]